MKRVVAAIALLLSFMEAGGQSLGEDTVRIETITVVSATKRESEVDRVPSIVSVVGRAEIESSGQSALLPVLTGRVPGLFVTRRGVTGFGVSKGSAGQVNIRGVGSGDKVLMMVDGQPQWAGIFGHHLPDQYVTSDAERVEVIRGPASLLYGSNAMGGVVNVITRKPDASGLHGRVRVNYGSYNTQKYSASAGWLGDRLELFAAFNHDRTDGHRDNSQFHITNGFGKISYRLSRSWKTTAEAVAAKFKSHNPGTVDVPMTDNWVDAFRGTYSFALENNYDRTSGALKAFYNDGDHEINDGWRNGKPRDYLFRSKDHNAGVLAYQTVNTFKGNTVTAGVDYKNWGGRAWQKYEDRNQDQVDKTVNETAVYLLAIQDIATRWTFHAGIRRERNQSFGGQWIPQAGATYRAGKGTTLKTSFAKGFRSPNLRDLYMYQAANPDLKPESMLNYDISLLQDFFNMKLMLEATAFYIDGKNMIEAVPLQDGDSRNRNVGSFKHAGAEFSGIYRINSSWTVRVTYSYLHTADPVLYAPEHQTFTEVVWQKRKWTLGANFQLVNNLYSDTDVPVKENYAVLNARASYELTKNISLSINAENLTDTNYSIMYGFPMPGITVIGGLGVKF